MRFPQNNIFSILGINQNPCVSVANKNKHLPAAWMQQLYGSHSFIFQFAFCIFQFTILHHNRFLLPSISFLKLGNRLINGRHVGVFHLPTVGNLLPERFLLLVDELQEVLFPWRERP